MARRLIVDTGLVVGAERGDGDLSDFVAPDDDLVVAAITVAELRAGVELASERHREARRAFLARVLDLLAVEPYDVATAEAHAHLLAHVRRIGEPRGAHDLIVAATAVVTGRTILTGDRRARFGDLPGVDCIVVGR